MANLEALIRLRRHHVEEKQKILGDLFREVEVFEAQKKDLYARLKKERDALNDLEGLETRDFYGLFEGTIRKNIERVDIEIRNLDTRITLAQEEVRAAFADMKRVEIVHKRRKEEEKQALKDKESAELDAIGIEGFRRGE